MPKKSNLIISAIAILGLGVSVFFQNCGEVNFQNKASNQALSPGEPEVPTPTVVPPIECAENQVEVDGLCEDLQTAFTECERFIDLGNLTDIPPLAESGTCYYKKIVNQTPSAASGSRGEPLAIDVWASKHGSDSRPNVQGAAHPFEMGNSGMLRFNFLGPRSMSLTSSAVADVDEIDSNGLSVDNFVLVEFDRSGAYSVLARGTQDSQISYNGHISPIRIDMGGSNPPVNVTDFMHYATGGTAQVGVIHLNTPTVLFDGQVSLRARMLDCGSSAKASDVYLVIH